jgi:glucose-6-phosphate-specific signal transduction histidine kinase
MSKHIPLGVLAVAVMALALSVSYAAAGARHLETLWLVPVSLAFTGIGLLGVAVAIKLREYGTRLAALERGLQDRPGLGR